MIPSPSELRPCPECGTLVLWTVTRNQKYLLVDGKPDDKGNQACYRVRPRTWQSRSLDAAGAERPAKWEHRFRPHVDTCAKRKPQQTELPLPMPLPSNVVQLRRPRRPRQREETAMSSFTANLSRVEKDIRAERVRQDAKWGRLSRPQPVRLSAESPPRRLSSAMFALRRAGLDVTFIRPGLPAHDPVPVIEPVHVPGGRWSAGVSGMRRRGAA
jgi:hypothetical protein